jgi:putative sterol carrier protein
VAEGRCTISEQRVQAADLVMTQTPETFIKTFAHMHNPMLAMLTRQVRVRGLRNMGTFAQLMPPESDDLSLPVNLRQPLAAMPRA